jgi:phasin family protein
MACADIECSITAWAFKRRKYKMNNVEQLQQDLSDTAKASADTFATSFQAIASAHADFAKKLMQHNFEFMSQLSSVKEPAKLMEVQREYVKNEYETFVAQSKRLAELYADLFKQTTKPFQDLIAKNKAA